MLTISVDTDVELRLLEVSHTRPLFQLVDGSRTHLRQWLPWVDDVRSEADTGDFIQAAVRQHEGDDGFQAGIWWEGHLAGMIGYHAIDWPNRRTSIGYWIGESFQRRGLVTRSCRRLVDYAFSDLGLNRVEIHCATENRRSRAIPERLGFVEEGLIREGEWLYDHFVDLVSYGKLSSEWGGVT